MHIFTRKKKQQESELNLIQVQEKKKYDIAAVFAKALLIFLLVYGSIGGFLSAFEMEYNKSVCILVIFLTALLLSAVYETGKRWLINLCSSSFFAVYFYIASARYWVINSGYYAILNRIFEAAREYLGVTNGMEYSLMVEDEYMTVTAFALFLGLVGAILLSIHLQYKASLYRVFSDTFLLYVIPLYLDKSPSLIYVILLFSGYAATAMLQGGKIREYLSKQMRYALPFAVLLTILVVRGAAFLLPEKSYGQIVPVNAHKAASESNMADFARYGMMAFFYRGSSGAGISGGMLSRGSAVVPDYETDLIVRYTPYSYDPVYLRAFVGQDYEGTRWGETELEVRACSDLQSEALSRYLAFYKDSSSQGRGIMEIEIAGASEEYNYIPYYTDRRENEWQGNVFTCTYYPDASRKEQKIKGWTHYVYLEVPDSCHDAVEQVCEKAGFSGGAEEIAEQIKEYFQENYAYTLRPGLYYGSPDYITHFLLESKKGYCSHFASAGTMMFRYLGIPARYVEGYAFSYQNVVVDGRLVEGAAYEDYYSGYSPIGETALVELEIPDAYAHAWVEIYVEGKGWIVVDPTPSSSEGDTGSFWDAFMNLGGGVNASDLGTGNLGAYLEGALGGITYAVAVLALLAAVLFLIIEGIRRRKESRLPGKERVRLEYARLQKVLAKKCRDYGSLRTLHEQFNRMRTGYGIQVSDEQEETLYRVFFAKETAAEDLEYGKLCGEIKKLRKDLKNSRPIKDR